MCRPYVDLRFSLRSLSEDRRASFVFTLGQVMHTYCRALESRDDSFRGNTAIWLAIELPIKRLILEKDREFLDFLERVFRVSWGT